MLRSLRHTWIALILALVAITGSGGLIVRSFLHHTFVDCRGMLRSVPASPLTESARRNTKNDVHSELEVRYDTVTPGGATKQFTYTNVRFVWTRADAIPACTDVDVPWKDKTRFPPGLHVLRDDVSGLYFVELPATQKDGVQRDSLVVFRKVDERGHRFQRDRILEGHNVSMLVFLFALGALGVAAFRAIRAKAYATTMHAWRSGTLRPDGLVEGESGASLGMMEPRSRIPAGPVIVDPAAFEGRDVYREMPILTRRTVGAGEHARWHQGTMRRLRDARSLAIIATMTTTLALVARLVG